jgi:hypothetical protein
VCPHDDDTSGVLESISNDVAPLGTDARLPVPPNIPFSPFKSSNNELYSISIVMSVAYKN